MALGKPSMPRPEIDLIAFNLPKNELVLFEVKSYLDSPGVKYAALAASTNREGLLKLLTDARYQSTLADRLKAEYVRQGLAQATTTVRFGLAAGNVLRDDRERIRTLAIQRGWEYLSPEEIAAWVRSLEKRPYENEPVTRAAKLILRSTESIPHSE